MAVLIALLLVALSVSAIALPLVRGHRRDASADPLSIVEDLLRQRQAVYDEINTLRLEYELGNVSAEDYSARLDEDRRRAALLLKRQERVQDWLARMEEEVEEEVRRARDGSEAEGVASPSAEKGSR